MKLFLTTLLLAAVPTAVAMECKGRITSCDDCVKCKGASYKNDDTKCVTINLKTCKGSAVSWACCTDGYCNGNVVGAPPGENKVNEVEEITICGLPAMMQSLPLQVHDGQVNFNEDWDNGFCGGSENSGNPFCSGICNVAVDIISGVCGPNPEMMNDPHMRSWGGEWFDYMGECDLTLMHVPHFDGKQDIDIHVRTTIHEDYSYIEAAALKIGKDILEVGAWGDYALNGVEGAMRTDDMIPKVGGYQVYYKQVNKKKFLYDVVIDEERNITISSFKDWVSVQVSHGDEDLFGSVSGLMGNYKGEMLGRDGTNLHDDINAMGQSWQVLPEEGSLFRTVRAPQYPEKCNLPAPQTRITRRLGEGIAEEAAEFACRKLSGAAFSFCVHDVMATGDLEFAESGAF
jgi:hypothetical protein